MKSAYRGDMPIQDWLRLRQQEGLFARPTEPRTPKQQERRLAVLAQRAATAVGTSDMIELRETIKDYAAKDRIPYNGVKIDAALRRAIGIRGQAL